MGKNTNKDSYLSCKLHSCKFVVDSRRSFKNLGRKYTGSLKYKDIKVHWHSIIPYKINRKWDTSTKKLIKDMQ